MFSAANNCNILNCISPEVKQRAKLVLYRGARTVNAFREFITDSIDLTEYKLSARNFPNSIISSCIHSFTHSFSLSFRKGPEVISRKAEKKSPGWKMTTEPTSDDRITHISSEIIKPFFVRTSYAFRRMDDDWEADAPLTTQNHADETDD